MSSFKITEKFELTHEMNLLFHEFGFDLVPRKHCLFQMLAEQVGG